VNVGLGYVCSQCFYVPTFFFLLVKCFEICANSIQCQPHIKMKKSLTFVCLFILLTTAACLAQQEKGDLSIQFSGNYASQKIKFQGSSFDVSSGSIFIKFGQFFTPNIELGVKPNMLFYTEPDPGDSKKKKLKTNVGFGLYGTYSFLTADGKMIPYAGGEINYVPSGKESTVNLGPYGGVKYFFRENINIDANMNYSMNVGSSFGDGALDIGGLFQFNVGIGVILGKLN
jgi:hypothetical protein